jgi:charged multivesicular body protein 4
MSQKKKWYEIVHRNKGDKLPTISEAIQKLKETEGMLIKKQDFLEKKIEQEIAIARKNAAKNKKGI